MSFSPSLFLSHMRSKDGPAKPSRFEVILPIPKYINQFVPNNIIENLLNLPNALYGTVQETIGSLIGNGQPTSANATLTRYLALQCEAAELPGRTLQTQEAKVYGPVFKIPYQTQYNEMTLTFLSTNDFWERKLFDRWIEAIHPSDTNNLRYSKGPDTYMTQIKVIQYDDFIKQIYAVELIDAFPIGVASQQLNWSEDGFHRVSVQFAYQRYRPVYDGNYDLAAAAAALLGKKLTSFLPFGRAIT
jgi:hypothetical protein